MNYFTETIFLRQEIDRTFSFTNQVHSGEFMIRFKILFSKP